MPEGGLVSSWIERPIRRRFLTFVPTAKFHGEDVQVRAAKACSARNEPHDGD
jgi:hypothetical protein